MQEFFAKTGNHKLRFKPAFNPYTEPSMEVFSWHEGLGKWIEIANVSSAGRARAASRKSDAATRANCEARRQRARNQWLRIRSQVSATRLVATHL